MFTALVLSLCAQAEAPLPPGVRAVWDLEKAFREATPTRERVCLNGLWRWQPAKGAAGAVPSGGWGFYKVPGFWPSGLRYDREDTQTLHAHPRWKPDDLRGLAAAWYQRTVTVPAAWAGRRITLHADTVNSLATVFIDGRKAGDIRFPGGEADLSDLCKPGETHTVSMLVHALPLKGVLLSYSDTNSAREVRGAVERPGLCGDVFLAGAPRGPRVADVRVETSVRKGEIAFDAALEALAGGTYALRAEILDGDRAVQAFSSRPFKAPDLAAGRFAFSAKWAAPRLWDLHTPQNVYHARVSLLEGEAALDVAHPVRFGFREFWIDGRDFILNGTRLFLSVVPLDNGELGARAASYEGARGTMARLRSFGINFVYTHNYGCEPGTHVGFGEILRAADDTGLLIAFSQPHFGQYDWKAPDAEAANGYARHAEAYVRMAQNHPSVVAYSMSHNATGYAEDMNPHLMDGTQDPRDTWSRSNARNALRAEAIVRRYDPSRIVYHHSSGNLGAMHTVNFYANFVPVQEMSDWFETWATKGAKPVFPVEYGVPLSWDWAMYRGWYKGERSFGSAQVPWEFCTAEWNAQFLGDAAYRVSEKERIALRWEAARFREGKLWHRWDYPRTAAIEDFEERHAILATYVTENLRAHRAWGVSALNAAWEYQSFWKLRPGADRGRKELKVEGDALQRPGFSADFVPRRSWPTDVDYDPADWVPTAAGEALLRNNRPLLAFIAGKPERFTSKDHLFLPGETVEKQVIVINNSREAVTCEVEWRFNLPQPVEGRRKIDVAPGRQERIPLRAGLPDALPPGAYGLEARVRFATGETQADAFSIHVLSRPSGGKPAARLALHDPKGETAALLKSLGVAATPVDASSDLASHDVLVIGKEALTVDAPGPDLRRVREGLRAVVFEQSPRVLEERFGFRIAEYGLRQVFRRVPGHPVLAGLADEHLRDWRGEATLVPPRLSYTLRPRHGPTVRWCGIEVSRLWRCGNRGNVASVLLEKPARGDFLPLLDGGYGLQYSPLLLYREGKGMILFCQADVSGRTEREPAAEILVRNLLEYAAGWKPEPERPLFYAGEAAGKAHLEAAGFSPKSYAGGPLPADAVLVLGPGATVRPGGRVLGLGGELPFEARRKKEEHIAAWFEPPPADSPFAGISPAEVHNRDPKEVALVSEGAERVGNGVLARKENAVYCALAPWSFDPAKASNLKKTFRSVSRLATRLAANLGAASAAPVLERFRVPPRPGEKRWLTGLYLDTPEEWDDPYRFFRW